MRRMLMALGMAVVLLCVCGCSGVIMSPEYSRMLDRSVELSEQFALRAESGQLTPPEMIFGLRANANTWKLFQAARDGMTVELGPTKVPPDDPR